MRRAFSRWLVDWEEGHKWWQLRRIYSPALGLDMNSWDEISSDQVCREIKNEWWRAHQLDGQVSEESVSVSSAEKKGVLLDLGTL